jgi:uncharacterized protein (TIGR00266 family)
MASSHDVDYEIVGDGAQMLIVELDPGESVIAEAGVMNFMEEGIEFETKLGDGADPDQGLLGRMFSAGVRMVTGESLFMTHFTHNGQGKAHLGFAAPYPGSIVPVDLRQVGGKLICQKDSFLCAARGTKVSITFNRKLGAGFFGGEGFILQELSGDGMTFMHAGGTVLRRELNGQTLRVDTGCIVGFTEGVSYSIERAGGLRSMLFGGEGMFLASLSGTGSVWLQSLPFSRLADRILALAPSAGGDKQGEQ